MKTVTLRQSVNQKVKELGFTKKDVSVSVKVSGYSDSVEIQAKHSQVDLALLDKELRAFAYFDRCPVSGDILAGGNTYVSIRSAKGYTAHWSTKTAQEIALYA